MSRVLITGGAGFIGSQLSEKRLQAGDDVVVLDNFNDFYDPSLKERNIESLVGQDGFSLIRGDIRDNSALETAFERAPFDFLVHLAAMPGVRPSVQKPDLYYDVNCTGTVRLFDWVAKASPGCKVIFGSSSSVYGDQCPTPFKEEMTGDCPISPYAASKRAGELQAYVHHRIYGLNVCCLRFFTVYGPRQRPEMAIHKFTRQINEGEEVVVYGDGTAIRDFTYITDILDGIERAMENASGFQIFNLGESRTISILETIDLIAKSLGKKARVRHDPPCEGDVPITFADLTLARKELGYNPKVDVAAGVDAFVRWFLEQGAGGNGALP